MLSNLPIQDQFNVSYISGLKKLNSQYGSFNPSAQIPGLINWYRADSVVLSGSSVIQLLDKKGSVNLSQQTISRFPVWNQTDSFMNQNPSISFLSSSLTSSVNLPVMSGTTVYLVTRAIVALSTGRMVSIGNTTDARSLTVTNTAPGFAMPAGIFANPSNTLTSRRVDLNANQAFWATNTPGICSISFDSTSLPSSSFITLAGVNETNTANNSSNATQNTILSFPLGLGADKAGSSLFTQFVFAELMICNQAHSKQQMQEVNSYLAWYYGVL